MSTPDRAPVNVPQLWQMVAAIARNLAALGFVARPASDAQNGSQMPKEAAPHAS